MIPEVEKLIQRAEAAVQVAEGRTSQPTNQPSLVAGKEPRDFLDKRRRAIII